MMVCYMSLYPLFLFLQQKVYEVKLEDGNVYVKHASRLSLQPFPAGQKSWITSVQLLPPSALRETAVASLLGLFLRLVPQTQAIWNIPKPYLPFSQTASALIAANSGRYQEDCLKRTWHHEIVSGFFLLLFQVETHHRHWTWRTSMTHQTVGNMQHFTFLIRCHRTNQHIWLSAV